MQPSGQHSDTNVTIAAAVAGSHSDTNVTIAAVVAGGRRDTNATIESAQRHQCNHCCELVTSGV
jgi:hypothetical protein